MTNWKEIHEDFTEELTYEWMRKGFNRKECKEWLDIGMNINNAGFCAWLRDEIKINSKISSRFIRTSGWKENLAEQYEEYVRDNKLSQEVIEQIKNFNYQRLTSEQKLLLDRLISNKELRKKYYEYGLCEECHQPNTGKGGGWFSGNTWCRICNARRLQHNFSNWTSGNSEVDQFIQSCQLSADNYRKVLEWVPYEKFVNIEYLSEGGFGKIYRAKWINKGRISHWDTKKNEWIRKVRDHDLVVLKDLHHSQNITVDFLQEIICHNLFDYGNIVKCYGISQDPKTGNYLMIMQNMNGGNLREFLDKYHDAATFEVRFYQLHAIASGLNLIHEKGLVHRDLHSGNILNKFVDYRHYCHIADLGLCKPVNETDKGENVYGVLPYVAPEVLKGEGYTSASDIYSLGVVAYEMFSNASPCLNRNYDTDLALEICQGLRPDLTNLRIPQLLKDLIARCWNADPKRRPTSSELEKILKNWREEKKGGESEFARQLQEIEVEYNKTFLNTFYKPHSTAGMTSKRINTKEITRVLLQQQKTEECHIGDTEELTLDKFKKITIQDNQEQEEFQSQIQIPPKNND